MDQDHAEAPSVVHLIERTCARHPDVVAAAGVGEPLSYADLWTRASALAATLVDRGVRPGDRVGVWGVQCTDLVVGLVGILAARAAYVPIDPAVPASRAQLVARDAGLTTIVAPARRVAEAAGVAEVVPIPQATAPGTPPPLPAVAPDDAAYVIYTSGSTGRPKGVVVEHRSLVAMFGWMREVVPARPGDRFMGTASVAFDASVPYVVYPLVVGGTYVAIDSEVATDPHLLAAEIEAVRPRVLLTLPAMLRMLTEVGWAGDDRLDVWTGGERTAPDVIAYIAPRVRTLRNWYGPTEATVAVATAVLRPDDADSPVGFPPSHVGLVLLDDDQQPVRHGDVGELFITGGSLARGYLDDPGLTASRFRPISLDGVSARAYRTGDLARVRTDGSLCILGRVDDQLNLRGFRVEPGEVEAAIVAHPDVVDAVVLARPSADGDAILEAYVTTRGELDGTALHAHLRDVLPSHLVPTTVTVLDALPLGATGKVDRRRVAELAASRRAGAAIHGAPAGGTELERAVVQAIADVLAIDAADVRLDDDFFDLGGTSLKSVRLFVLFEERLGVHLPLSTLAAASTPRALAQAVADARHRGSRAGDSTPRHEWERGLAVLWREQLGVGHVERTDTVEGLGGTQEDARRVLAELRARYGVEVSEAELAAAPTLEALARLVGTRSRGDVLVPLTTTGTGPALFLIAGAGGLAITFLPLARLLGPTQPCYGLQAHGIERRAAPDLTLAAGARRYAREIRAVQPHGPYLLGGHSLGGVHALKVAQQLDEEGEEVALLAILDTPLSAAMAGRGAARGDGGRHAKAGAPSRRLPRLATVVRLPAVGRLRFEGTSQFEAFAALGEIQATLAKRLAPWAGPATLFLSDEDESALIEARWGNVLTGPWTSARVPGGHIAMLDRQNVATCAAILREQIDRALGRVAVGVPPAP